MQSMKYSTCESAIPHDEPHYVYVHAVVLFSQFPLTSYVHIKVHYKSSSMTTAHDEWLIRIPAMPAPPSTTNFTRSRSRYAYKWWASKCVFAAYVFTWRFFFFQAFVLIATGSLSRQLIALANYRALLYRNKFSHPCHGHVTTQGSQKVTRYQSDTRTYTYVYS